MVGVIQLSAHLCSSFVDVHLCVLCNPEPSLSVLHGQVPLFWSTVTSQLRSSSHLYPRCIHLGVTLEASVLAFTLVSSEARRSLTCLKPTPSGNYSTAPPGTGEETLLHRGDTSMLRQTNLTTFSYCKYTPALSN